MANLKARINVLESMARSIKKFMRAQYFVFDGTESQAAEIAKLKEQGIKVRLFNVVE